VREVRYPHDIDDDDDNANHMVQDSPSSFDKSAAIKFRPFHLLVRYIYKLQTLQLVSHFANCHRIYGGPAAAGGLKLIKCFCVVNSEYFWLHIYGN